MKSTMKRGTFAFIILAVITKHTNGMALPIKLKVDLTEQNERLKAKTANSNHNETIIKHRIGLP